MKIKKFLTFVLIIASLSLGGLVHAEEIDGDKSAITATPSSYDFGDIEQDKGKVSTVVKIENTGDESIKLNRLSTSCGCTTAEMDMSDLLSGEVRDMKITFDPMAHPDESGPITRMVYLQTSDPVMPELSIEITGNVIAAEAAKEVVVFFNEACQDCGELVNDFYPGFFEKYGYGIVTKDYINERENRTVLNEYNEKWGVPFELQSHIEAFVDEKLLIGGHVPQEIMSYLLENSDKYDRLLVYQDKMHGEATDYKVWDFKGEIKTYNIDEPISTYFDEIGDHNDSSGSSTIEPKSFWPLLSLITFSAFLDGINPCAIAVLLFFIAFLFSMKKTKRSIWKMGVVYIAAIYLAYLLIGIGLAQAIIISGAPHLMAYIGAYLVIGLGVIQLIGVFIPRFPIRLAIPVNTKATVEKWLYRSTIPAAFIAGFIVGLCTFPCSGGIYVAIIGMLSSSQTYLNGFLWMLWYNLIFVAPLIILLFLAANKITTERLQRLERKGAKYEKLVIGIAMIALGLIIILFFV